MEFPAGESNGLQSIAEILLQYCIDSNIACVSDEDKLFAGVGKS